MPYSAVAYGSEPNARRLSYHTDFSTADPTDPADFSNPITERGPMEGRPPGEIFAHQRWDEFFPKVGYVCRWVQIAANQCFYPARHCPFQDPKASGPTAPATPPTPSGTCRRP